LTGLGRERLARIIVKAPGMAICDSNGRGDLHIVTRKMEPITVDMSDMPGFHDTAVFYGSHFQYAAEPSQPIEGTVRDAKTHEPVPGVKVWSNKFAGTTLSGVYALKTVSDAQGHYRLDGMPKGEGNSIVAVPGDDQPYFMREFKVPTGPGLEPVKFYLDLDRGVMIEGRIIDKASGTPITNARMYYVPWPDNPNIKALPEFNHGTLPGPQVRYTVDAQGHYKVVGLPGRGLVEVENPGDRPYPHGQGLSEIPDLPSKNQFRNVAGVFAPTEAFCTAVKQVQIDQNQQHATVDIELSAGEQLTLKLVDPDGNPLDGVDVRGLWPLAHYHQEENAGPTIQVQALLPDEKRLVRLYNKERNLGKAIRVSLKDDGQGPLTVKLEPCATVTARLLDKDGEPLRGARIRFDLPEPDFLVQLEQAATDLNGRFTKSDVLPGCDYNVECESTTFNEIAKKLSVTSGETIDLGEFDVTSKARPEPKRTGGTAANVKAMSVEPTAIDPATINPAGGKEEMKMPGTVK
jgi:hypothetical protein